MLRVRAIWLGLLAGAVSGANPTVTLDEVNVTYQGHLRGNVEDFHNIKFAQDTSGVRRFAPPQPYTPPKGSHVDATSPGPACPQSKAAIPPFFGEVPEISEDCLHLRITRPAGTTATGNLPVVVHLVGGGVVKGSTEEPLFDPIHLIERSSAFDKPIIHVVINYRLLIFGLPRLTVLKDQKSLNVGMRDQRCGTQWVKENIAAFGGDPNRITSFGLSSGGTFTSLHLTMYGGEQGVPFTQWWAMSGPPGTALNMTSDATELHTRPVAQKLGCGDSQDNDVLLLKCLRDTPMDKLTEAALERAIGNHPPAGLFTFIPSIDDDLIPDRQFVLYKSGRFVKGVPMVFGWAQDDGATNAGPAPAFQTEEDMKTPITQFAHLLEDEDYRKLFSLYPEEDFEQEVHSYEDRKSESDPVAPAHYFRAARIMRDLLFTCSSIDFGFEISRQSKAIDPRFPGVFHYELNQSMVTPLFHGAGMPYLGTVHGSDIDYLYNVMFPRTQMAETDRNLSDYMITSFLNFAYTGNPGQNAIAWPEAFTTPDQPTHADSEEGLGQVLQYNLQFIGGPIGTVHGQIGGEIEISVDLPGQELGYVQEPLVDNARFYDMASNSRKARHFALERARLLENVPS